jgi:hypothetical protein
MVFSQVRLSAGQEWCHLSTTLMVRFVLDGLGRRGNTGPVSPVPERWSGMVSLEHNVDKLNHPL